MRQDNNTGLQVAGSFVPSVGFRSEKAAQICAYLAHAWGGRIDKLALAKLLYIVERTSVRLRNRPMMYDECFSLKDGPVCKSALDGVNGHIDESIWSRYIHQHGRQDVYCVKDAVEYLDQLSESDLELIKGVVSEHLGKNGKQLRTWTHQPENVPEYTLVFGANRVPISYQQMAKHVGVSHPEDVSDNEDYHRRFESAFPRIQG